MILLPLFSPPSLSVYLSLSLGECPSNSYENLGSHPISPARGSVGIWSRIHSFIQRKKQQVHLLNPIWDIFLSFSLRSSYLGQLNFRKKKSFIRSYWSVPGAQFQCRGWIRNNACGQRVEAKAAIWQDWQNGQRQDIVKAKVAVADAEADILAWEQSKNKLLAQCIESGRRFKPNAPVSSQDDVNLMFTFIQKLPEQDKLFLMRKEIKFKKLVLSELQKEFVLFKQLNLSSTKMFQNLLALHAAESTH